MKALHFTTLIQAPRETVWDTMLGPATYRIWTAAFAEGSYFEGSWDQGQRIRFLAPDGRGMTAQIAENREHEFVSIKHLGYVKDGIDDTESEEVRSWAPAFENYSFMNEGAATRVNVDMDITPDFEEYMLKTWPVALAKLKALCESLSNGGLR
jgi:uncharacterized protein YndB with AHSA1/START domain